jgi:hypothetical protein
MPGNNLVRMRNKQQTARKLARQQQVMSLRLAGVNDVGVIAQQLGVSRYTVERDFQEINDRWKQQTMIDTATLKGRQHARIEASILSIWQEVRAGRLGAIKTLVQLLDREASLMGLDAPKTMKLDLEARIRAMAEREGFDPDEAIREAQRLALEAG